ncbi:hypothetical protein AG1IA_10074 [Rhizoctonia solani AG-1 IA]|uniref:Transmembrane protein n=1 Tax=Thanatephorus cucumeris (strain AG1-IA) TaxID=983506 RepID=L8WCK4_THACA|nr:hypothetical protein AG1IA_10074 [Rhizoctonia solani AG-1 IA]
MVTIVGAGRGWIRLCRTWSTPIRVIIRGTGTVARVVGIRWVGQVGGRVDGRLGVKVGAEVVSVAPGGSGGRTGWDGGHGCRVLVEFGPFNVSSRSAKRLFVSFQTMRRITKRPAILPVTARPMTVDWVIPLLPLSDGSAVGVATFVTLTTLGVTMTVCVMMFPCWSVVLRTDVVGGGVDSMTVVEGCAVVAGAWVVVGVWFWFWF